MTPHDREREARAAAFDAVFFGREGTVSEWAAFDAALDAYRDAIEARVRWDQQADAEGYDIPGGPR